MKPKNVAYVLPQPVTSVDQAYHLCLEVLHETDFYNRLDPSQPVVLSLDPATARDWRCARAHELSDASILERLQERLGALGVVLRCSVKPEPIGAGIRVDVGELKPGEVLVVERLASGRLKLDLGRYQADDKLRRAIEAARDAGVITAGEAQKKLSALVGFATVTRYVLPKWTADDECDRMIADMRQVLDEARSGA